MYGIELFMIWVGLSTICLYPADERELISSPAELVISFCHHLEQQALKYPATTEYKGNS